MKKNLSVDRRTFCQTLSAAASGLALYPALPALALPQEKGLSFKLSVMAWTLGRTRPLDQRLEEIAQAGFNSFELVGEYQDWSDADYKHFNEKKRSLGLSCDCFADRVIPGAGIADPTGGELFLNALKNAIVVSKKLESPVIIVRTGPRLLNVSHVSQHDACIENLSRGADLAAKEDITLLLENLDREENPTTYLTSSEEGLDIVRRTANPHAKFLYDLYHTQLEEGNLIKKLNKDTIGLIGVVHIADAPGRHEPGTGEINYPNIYRKLMELKFSGFVAMEFLATGDLVVTLRNAREGVMRSANILN
jgi:hydroxypyruvate isomerase